MQSLGRLFSGLQQISSDNVANFTSYEFVGWAVQFDITLDNSGAWNPAGNMHAAVSYTHLTLPTKA